MKIRKASKGQIFRCGVGHHWPEALLVEGQEPPHLNGTYCLVCFGTRIVGRLDVPRADAVADPFEPAQTEPETEQSAPPAAEEETIARAEEVPTQDADPDNAGTGGEGPDADAEGEPSAD